MNFLETTSSFTSLQKDVLELIIESLNLEITHPVSLDDPLYGDGLGLDSIDILEIALVISKRYSLQLRANSDENHHIFRTLRTLTDYISDHQANCANKAA